MADRLLLALAQLNPAVGDVAGNINKILSHWREAEANRADLVITPEHSVTGYPLEDFALNPNLLKATRQAVEALARKTASGPALLIGTPWVVEDKVRNAALLLEGGGIAATCIKYDLPNYGPFDEKRVFTAGELPGPVEFHGFRLGIMVCEDMWKPAPAMSLREKGAQVLIVLNGSPFEAGKQKEIRYELVRQRARETGLPLIYVNLLGGQDELVFDGASFAMDATGELCAQAKVWEEQLLSLTLLASQDRLSPQDSLREPLPDDDAATYGALVTGTRDYVNKNGFPHVLIGLSGGIDSALVAAVAVDALGADRVRTVLMPSPYTSRESVEDATAVARLLGVRMDTISIVESMRAFERTLAESFAGCRPDVTEENIQSRCRGLILMALANKSDSIVLITANKSEMATGYATLYGDMCGGYAPLKDVYKTVIYRLGRWRNGHKPSYALGPAGLIIPQNVLMKAPTAELRPNQTDQDTLPPYDELDAILNLLVEKDMSLTDVLLRGHDVETVQRVWKMLARAEYKRRQAPPGPKVTPRHFTRDRRYPITNSYIEK